MPIAHWGCGDAGFKSRRPDHHVEKADVACRRGGFSCIRPARLPFPKAVERENSMATAFFFISKIGWLLVKPLNCLGLCLLAWLGCRRLGWRRLSGLFLAVLLLYGDRKSTRLNSSH